MAATGGSQMDPSKTGTKNLSGFMTEWVQKREIEKIEKKKNFAYSALYSY